jgi:hypothetical protein
MVEKSVGPESQSVKGAVSSAQAAGEASRPNTVLNLAVAADLVSPEERHLRISEAAYRRAQARGFVEGGELEDWLEAEREVDGVGNAR